jgi:2-dehydro-3-deoxy-D-arabinonate dehydratase
MKLYRTTAGVYALDADEVRRLDRFEWDAMFASADPAGYCRNAFERGTPDSIDTLSALRYLPPVDGQEIWAAGVTYYRSRDARMAESKKSGGDSFYDRVYDAERPEIFYKGSTRNTVGSGTEVRIRSDSAWNVPEPELTLAIDSRGRIFGYTCGNDMSSRDIEGENPLYLPQAKVYDGSCALGPCLLIADTLPPTTEISIDITRRGESVFSGRTTIAEIKRPLASLAGYLYRDNTFPAGTLLLTGTGIVPDESFTLEHGDSVQVGIVPIGTLENVVA